MSDKSRLFLAAVLMLGVLLISWFVSGKGNSGVVDNTLVQGGCNHGVELTTDTAINSGIESGQHVLGVCGVQFTTHARCA